MFFYSGIFLCQTSQTELKEVTENKYYISILLMSKHSSVILGLMCIMAMAMESSQEQGISWGREEDDQVH